MSDTFGTLSWVSTAPGTASTVVGYARVSTIGQTLEQQTEALEAAGAGRVFHDAMSAEDVEGEALATLVVNNMRGIVNTLHELTGRGVTVRSLHDGVDTSTSTGRMVAGILMSIAEYER